MVCLLLSCQYGKFREGWFNQTPVTLSGFVCLGGASYGKSGMSRLTCKFRRNWIENKNGDRFGSSGDGSKKAWPAVGGDTDVCIISSWPIRYESLTYEKSIGNITWILSKATAEIEDGKDVTRSRNKSQILLKTATRSHQVSRLVLVGTYTI